jgi:PAS domain S-box-containing protein
MTSKQRRERARNTAGELRRLRLAIEASGEIIFTTDAQGTFTYVNPAFQRVYGYEPSEVVGRATPRILKSGSTPPDDYETFWAHLQHSEIVRREFVNHTKDGVPVHIDSSANPIVDVGGTLVGFLAVQRDVTEQRNLERQLLHAQKMEAIGRLAGGIAHDFNNLLTAILGYVELVRDRVLAADALDDLDEIRKAGERASRLTRQLLAFSRKQPMTRQVVDVNVLVADLAKMLGRVLGEDIALSVVIAPTLWPVLADASQLEQVLLNVAVNSRDAMPQGGRLEISTANAELDAAFVRRSEGARPGSYVSLSIRDTGCGMPADVIARAFEPFFTTKPLNQGTGLGLSTVYGIVKQNGGYVTIESQPDVGTTVTIFWPKAEEERQAAAPASQPAPQPLHGAETILLVEDEPGIRGLMRRSLTPLGYRVIEARDGSEALALAAGLDGTLDLLLSDVVMPGVNGPELADQLRARHNGLRILYVSGFPSSRLSEEDRKRQRAKFLAKPFTPHTLAVTVRECLDSAR